MPPTPPMPINHAIPPVPKMNIPPLPPQRPNTAPQPPPVANEIPPPPMPNINMIMAPPPVPPQGLLVPMNNMVTIPPETKDKDNMIRITFEYMKCTLNNCDGVFIGQYKKCSKSNTAIPEGFVRFISSEGNVYEGHSKGQYYDGWGRFTYSNSTFIGHWKLIFKKYGSFTIGYNRRFLNGKVTQEGYFDGMHRIQMKTTHCDQLIE